MKLFKTIDEKLRDLGFVKVRAIADGGACYEREITKYGYITEHDYIQCLEIMHKANGKHLIQSYQKGVNKDGFNNVVGLTYEETKLAMKKYKQLKREYNW